MDGTCFFLLADTLVSSAMRRRPPLLPDVFMISTGSFFPSRSPWKGRSLICIILRGVVFDEIEVLGVVSEEV